MDQNILLMYAGAALLSLAFSFLFIRWAHRITGQIDRLNASVLILAEIAVKSGVSRDKIEGILNSNMIDHSLSEKE